MSFQILASAVGDPEADYVYRSQRAAAARVDPSDTYERETVNTTVGTRNTPVAVVLRFPIGHEFSGAGFHVFACYGDNPAWHARPESEWAETAKRALQKFAAIRGRVVKVGPLVEAGAPLNLFVELQGARLNEEPANG